MLKQLVLQDILFLDIETVSQQASFEELSEKMQYLWEDKTKYQRGDEHTPEEFYPQRAGIMAEFGKIVCISIGYIYTDSGVPEFRLKSFYDHDEHKLLSDFSSLLYKHYSGQRHLLCGHNAKEFDFPYIARRMLLNGIELPPILNIAGKKPWEIKHLDTMELWKFGDYKHYTSLKLLTAIFDIPTPKDDIDGSMVGEVYWKEGDLKRIALYCEKDVLAVAQLLLRYRAEDLIAPEYVSFSVSS